MADNIDSVISAGTGGGNTQQLGSIMNMGLQAQQVQSNRLSQQIQGQTIQSNDLALQKSQQANDERIAVMPVIQSLMKPDGTFDLSQARKIIEVAPQTGADYIQHLAGTNEKSFAANQGLLNLDKDAQGFIGQALPNMKNKSAAEMLGALQDIATTTPATQPFVDQIAHQIGQAVNTTGNDAKAQQDALGKILDFNSKRVLSIAQQNELNTPKYQNTGATQTNINPMATAQDLPNTLAPGERSRVIFNQNGQPMTETKPENGLNPTISATPVGGHATEPFVMPTNENADTLKYVQNLRQNANVAASNVPQTQAFANNAIKYSSGATTGTGSAFINNLKGQYAGTPWTAAGATDTNLMGHALSQLTGSLIQSSGLSTNQGQSLVANQVANNEWTKDSIKTASREVRALSTGANLFNQGMENTIAKVSASQGASSGQFSAREFQNAWSKAADVNAYKLYDAIKNKNADPEGLKNIINQLGGPTPKKPDGSIIYQQTLKNIDKMKTLLSGGK
jgi:hypothetical protein